MLASRPPTETVAADAAEHGTLADLLAEFDAFRLAGGAGERIMWLCAARSSRRVAALEIQRHRPADQRAALEQFADQRSWRISSTRWLPDASRIPHSIFGTSLSAHDHRSGKVAVAVINNTADTTAGMRNVYQRGVDLAVSIGCALLELYSGGRSVSVDQNDRVEDRRSRNWRRCCRAIRVLS